MRKPRTSLRNREEIALIPDIHIPYHLPRCTDLVLKYCRDYYAPDRVVFIGDLLDAYSISRFDKDPNRRITLAEEVGECREFLCAWRESLSSQPMHLLEGNHEHRLPKYLKKVAPEFNDLEGLSVPELLKLSDLGIQWHSSLKPLVLGPPKNPVVITHGNRIRKQGGMTALAISDEREQSILCGHSHRMGLSFRTTASGIRMAAELGCLCDYRKMDYIDSVPNWQVGFATLSLQKGHHPQISLKLIDRPYSRKPTIKEDN